MQISFKAKIPLSNCNLLNMKTQQFEKATIYEINCRDKDDVDYINSAQGSWKYKSLITRDAQNKLYNFYNPRLSRKNKKESQVNRFYSIEDKNGNIRGLLETDLFEKDINIKFIESSPEKDYKFAAQNLLANIAKQALDLRRNVIVSMSHPSADKFYSEVCNFQKVGCHSTYILPFKYTKIFIRIVEKRTEA